MQATQAIVAIHFNLTLLSGLFYQVAKGSKKLSGTNFKPLGDRGKPGSKNNGSLFQAIDGESEGMADWSMTCPQAPTLLVVCQLLVDG